jgi:hypothetical protein
MRACAASPLAHGLVCAPTCLKTNKRSFDSRVRRCVFRPPERPGGYGDTGETELKVQFLDRHKFPSGAVGTRKNTSRLYWDVPNVKRHEDELVILHDNWIKGFAPKVRRMVEQRLWYYNREEMVCIYEDDVHVEFTWGHQYVEA